MAIDASGEWWRGENHDDLAEYLEECAAGGYRVDRVVQATCAGCAGRTFRLRCDPLEGSAERTCVGCGQASLMLDSGDHWDDTDPEEIGCPCGSDEFDAAVGFSLLATGEVRWISIGIRCVADGVLGCVADWKIDYSPSQELLDRV